MALGQRFGAHLEASGWQVLHHEDQDFLLATHGTETLAAELEARTLDHPGDYADRLYGRLLRRLPDYPQAHVVGVVPERMRWHVSRVPESVRDALHLDIYLVDDLGGVHRLRSGIAEAAPPSVEGLERVLAAFEELRDASREETAD